MVNKELTLDTEEKILQAATKVFERDGYAGARMQVIADEAGMNKALLHYYFRSKEKLFSKIFLEKYNKFFSTLSILADQEMDFFEKIDKVIDSYMEMLIQNPEMPSMLINTITHHPELIQKLNTEGAQKMRIVLQSESEKGNIIAVESLQILTSVVGLCIMPFLAKPIAMHVFKLDMDFYQQVLLNRGPFVKKAVRAILKP